MAVKLVLRGRIMNEKIAVISDIHGNVTAFEAVLAHARANGATRFWFLGDLFMPGPGVSELIETLRDLQPDVWLRGNWDNVLGETVRGEVDLSTPKGIYTARLAVYVLSEMSQPDFQAVNALPDATTRSVNGVNFALSHNLPGKNWGPELLPSADNAVFSKLLVDDSIDVAIYGHTHRILLREADTGALILNPGSVGNPFSKRDKFLAQRGARYLLLTVNDKGEVMPAFETVDYDMRAEMALAKRRGVPYLEMYDRNLADGAYYRGHLDLINDLNEKYHYQGDIPKILTERGWI
jgi:putative phosphoesterase